jgi:3-methyladenine DNA glycosylase AlkD
MKNKNLKNKEEKEFDTVHTFRVIKEKMTKEISEMNFEEIKAYLKKNSKKLYSK